MAVYFIRPIGMPGPVKIGCSEVPADRLDALSTWSPYPLEVVAIIEDGDMALERRIHGLFAAQHTHREWFRESLELCALIDRLRAGEPIANIIDMSVEVLPFRAPQGKTAEFRQRMSYVHRLRWAFHRINDGKHWKERFFEPQDVRDMFARWSGWQGFEKRAPTIDEIRRIEEVIAAPALHGRPCDFWRAA